MKAIWNNQVITGSNDTIVVDNNHYFPKESVRAGYLQPSHATCPWQGLASYHSLTMDGMKNPDAAWFYPGPKPDAANITNYVAFWKGVKVTD